MCVVFDRQTDWKLIGSVLEIKSRRRQRRLEISVTNLSVSGGVPPSVLSSIGERETVSNGSVSNSGVNGFAASQTLF